MRSESEPGDGVKQEDPFAGLKRDISDFHGYDELALDQYRTLSFYFAQRKAGMSMAQAKAVTCDTFGHDAPRGKCQRCGLGVELNAEDERTQRERRRVAERDAWLATRRR